MRSTLIAAGGASLLGSGAYLVVRNHEKLAGGVVRMMERKG